MAREITKNSISRPQTEGRQIRTPYQPTGDRQISTNTRRMPDDRTTSSPLPGNYGPPPPTQYNPADYQNQLASQLSPGFSAPTPIQGQFPMQGQAPMGMQPGFGQGGFNPQQGLFGSFAPQGGMFSGMFGGQR